jgi:hypothetical protein
MTTITSGATIITPDIVDGYDSAREAQTILHRVIGRADPDVTLRAAGTRSGTLSLVFGVEAEAYAAEQALAAPDVWTLTDPDRLTIGMVFVVAGGTLDRALVNETRDGWTLSVPFVEVLP